MKENNIFVKAVEDNWGVTVKGNGNNGSTKKEIFIKMSSKEDAVRYARICEQRTGGKVLLSE
ncbi:MAG: hypothetical protein LBR74_03425 [Eubacterium sp.]|jgi:hypothetical protein|nr:hypothetical protein [Eubacterium sp.]